MTPHEGTLPRVASILSVDAAHVVIETVKRADDDAGAIVVRLYEAWGRRGPVTLRTPWELRRASVTDLLEREIAPVATRGDTVTLDMAPFQITTVRLDVAPD